MTLNQFSGMIKPIKTVCSLNVEEKVCSIDSYEEK